MTKIIKTNKYDDTRIEVVVRESAQSVVDILCAIMPVYVCDNSSCFDVTNFSDYWTVIPYSGALADVVSLRDAIKRIL